MLGGVFGQFGLPKKTLLVTLLAGHLRIRVDEPARTVGVVLQSAEGLQGIVVVGSVSQKCCFGVDGVSAHFFPAQTGLPDGTFSNQKSRFG
jgi:hypothetical protein